MESKDSEGVIETLVVSINNEGTDIPSKKKPANPSTNAKPLNKDSEHIKSGSINSEHKLTASIQTECISSPSKIFFEQIDLLKQYPFQFSDIKNSKITYIEAWDLNLYIGTDQGEIIHLYKLDDVSGYIQISKQKLSNATKAVKKIVILSELSIVLVHYGSTVSGFLLPELSPANIGKAKDVLDISIDWNDFSLDTETGSTNVLTHLYNEEMYSKITLFTSTSIKFLKVFKSSMKLSGEIPFGGLSKGLRFANCVVLSNKKEYCLFDISQNRISCTFPMINDSLSGMPALIKYVNQEEIFLVGGGCEKNTPAVGMFINLKGNVIRGTITFERYPQSVTIEYPYILSSFENTILIHSISDQKKIQEIAIKDVTSLHLFRTARNFEIKDVELVKKITLVPIVSVMDNEEIQRIATEADVAVTKSICLSSVIGSDTLGKYLKIMKPPSKVERWLNIFDTATKETNIFVLDLLLAELVAAPDDLFLISLIGLYLLKWEIHDQIFSFWKTYLQLLDPRLIIFAYSKDNLLNSIFGSVWTHQILVDYFEDLKNQAKSPQMMKVLNSYLLFCLSNEFKEENINKHKSIEVVLIKLGIFSNKDMKELVKMIKYAKNEVVEELLISKKYFLLSKFYSHIEEHRQFLFYWKGLINGEFIDEEFNTNYDKAEALNFLNDYIFTSCKNDEQIVEQYSEWLLSEYPSFGMALITDSRLKTVKHNDIKILNLLRQHEIEFKIDYLEFIFESKNEKQFMGDLIISYLKAIIDFFKTETEAKVLTEFLSEYMKMDTPKVSIFKYWNLIDTIKLKNKRINAYHKKLYQYLSLVSLDTKSIFDQLLVMQWCKSNVISTELENKVPLISLIILDRTSSPRDVVEKFIYLKDYKSAESYAVNLNMSIVAKEFCKTNQTHKVKQHKNDELLREQLLGRIFDVYLQNGENQLIDEFLTKYDFLKSDINEEASMVKRIEKFVEVINKVPDSFPLIRLKRFMLNHIIELKEYDDHLVAKRALLKLEVNKMAGFKGHQL